MMRQIICFFLMLCTTICASAQSTPPTVSPLASYTTTDGEETDDASGGQNAPLVAHFTANPSNLGGYSVRYEWKIYRPGEEQTPLVHRFEEDIDYTFTMSGSFYVQLYATFVLGNDTIIFPEEGEANPIAVTINESKLDFPNAFSPNGDGWNDKFKAKDGYQSIISFNATIFSRWGEKIYSWNNPAGEWDGRWRGHRVKDGVYFLVVNAKGADGHKYNIRKAITVISGYDNDSTGTSSSSSTGSGGAGE